MRPTDENVKNLTDEDWEAVKNAMVRWLDAASYFGGGHKTLAVIEKLWPELVVDEETDKMKHEREAKARENRDDFAGERYH
jgi:hypothetical protein